LFVRFREALFTAGFDPGVIDGIYGAKTAEVVAAFQRVNGLVMDGEVGPLTAKALGVEL
jgi:peptidoglycan hydrolase-like protein with peptidoglycan-binding domain